MNVSKKQNETHSMVPSPTTLPSDVVQKIALYLSPRECSCFSRSCPVVNEHLNLKPLPPQTLGQTLAYDGASLQDFWFPLNVRIPVPIAPERTQSVALKIRWNDQRFGGQKARIAVVGWPYAETVDSENNDEQKETSTSPFSGGRYISETPFARTPSVFQIESFAKDNGGKVVAKSPLAPHTTTTTIMSFVPEDGSAYNLWAIVGGLGYSLHIQSLSVHVTAFDSPTNVISKNYMGLFHNNSLFSKNNETPEGSVLSPLKQDNNTIVVLTLLGYVRVLREIRSLLREDTSLSADRARNLRLSQEKLFSLLSEAGIETSDDESLFVLEDILEREHRALKDQQNDFDIVCAASSEVTEAQEDAVAHRNLRFLQGIPHAYLVDDDDLNYLRDYESGSGVGRCLKRCFLWWL
jgi:hypothetical protein